MSFEVYDSMTDSVRFGKERPDDRTEEEEENRSAYYDDDSTGYQVYDPDADDSEGDECEED